jgi:phosphoglucosamine mutase
MKLFGTDGIRDIVNSGHLKPAFLLKLGKVLGLRLSANKKKVNKVIIGKDTRPSGKMIESIITTGLVFSGVDVVSADVISTPGLAYLTEAGKYSLGIMISASHNPANYNGIKLFGPDGLKLSSREEQKIERDLQTCSERSEPKAKSPAGRHRPGHLLKPSRTQTAEKYIHRILNNVLGKNINDYTSWMKIVVDCAEGALSEIAPEIFTRLGARVIPIYHTGSGEKINQRCGALYPEILRQKVLSENASLGFSFDGDGDRVILVDEHGSIRDGDSVLYLSALFLKKHNKLRRHTVVGTIMTNSALEKTLKTYGIALVRTPVGDKYVLDEILKNNFSLGGEPSGHIIFPDYSKNGDGLITALIVLKIMKEENKSLEKLTEGLTKYPQLIVNIKVKSKPWLEEIKPLQEKVREIREILGEEGRLIVRYSGTEPLLRIMIEGRDESRLKTLARSLSQTIRKLL